MEITSQNPHKQNSDMEVVEIARTAVNTLNKLSNWGAYSEQYDVGPKEGDKLMETLAKIDDRLARVAWRRAVASGRDFEAVFVETKLEFYYNEAKFMETEMVVDPREAAMKMSKVVEEGDVCGICQEEFVVGEEVGTTACMHTLHWFCLWTWLYDHKTCPLCRSTLLD